jgi:hypothetical protein
VAGLLAGLGLLSIPGLGPVVAAGWLGGQRAIARALRDRLRLPSSRGIEGVPDRATVAMGMVGFADIVSAHVREPD